MVGAYQEILGDMHNLFGDTDSVDVDVTDAGEIVLDRTIQGDTVSSVLRYVNYDPDRLLESLEQHCRQAHLRDDEQEGLSNWYGMVWQGIPILSNEKRGVSTKVI